MNALYVVVAFALLSLVESKLYGQDFARGQELYKQLCSRCHGDGGQGNPEAYSEALRGDRSIAELAQVIDETMPEEDPTLCDLEDSKAIAGFIHHEFYSEMAQLRNAPPKQELSRLTATQFKNSVIDLLLSFHWQPVPWTQQHGLTAKYFDNPWPKGEAKKHEQVETRLSQDWGEAKPHPDISGDKWCVTLDGSLLTPETGVYEFFVKAKCRTKLHINDSQSPTVDATVLSGDDADYTGRVTLQAGRIYPISVQTGRNGEKVAGYSVEWKTPSGVRESIPARFLSPTGAPNTIEIQTPFPAEDNSIGFERGRSISKEWDEAVTATAIEVANRINEHPSRWIPGVENDKEDMEPYKNYCLQLVERAFRTELNDEEKQRYVLKHFAETDAKKPNAKVALKKILLVTFKNPRFQYPTIALSSSTRPWRVASHLALSIWDSIPDQGLRQAAKEGWILDANAMRDQIHRMLEDPRARAKQRDFFRQWLGLQYLKDLSKDSSKYPEFNEMIASDLRTSLDMFLDDFATDPKADLRTLLTADYIYSNGRLGKLYGLTIEDEADFRKVSVAGHEYSGILSHPYLMSGLAYHATSSPIHRGVFLAKRVLGRNLRPPVDAIIPDSETSAPDLTTRERVTLQTSGQMCQTCHRVINPLGFTLEHFDAVGRFRSEEKGKSIDAAGYYATTDGQRIEFRGVRELANFLGHSSEVHRSLAKQYFQHEIKQPIAAYGLTKLDELEAAFREGNFTNESLVHKIIQITLPQDKSADDKSVAVQP